MSAQKENWNLNVDIGDWGPRKVKPEELAAHIADRNEVVRIVRVLTKFNEILKENELTLHQAEGDCDTGITPAIQIGNYSTEIENETGLFYVPKIPEKWDENTIVSRRMPFACSDLRVEGMYTIITND